MCTSVGCAVVVEVQLVRAGGQTVEDEEIIVGLLAVAYQHLLETECVSK